MDRNFHDAVATVGKKDLPEGSETGITLMIGCRGVSLQIHVEFFLLFLTPGYSSSVAVTVIKTSDSSDSLKDTMNVDSYFFFLNETRMMQVRMLSKVRCFFFQIGLSAEQLPALVCTHALTYSTCLQLPVDKKRNVISLKFSLNLKGLVSVNVVGSVWRILHLI